MASVIINGKTIEAQEGQMLIDVADSAGIDIPRFCYHPKLSVAANCRMCLVEVKGGRKPVPACATPVTDGMIVNTQSETTKAAQKSVMEFLLINHPLDCPICDQGGECELQDVSLEFGSDISRYTVAKRVVEEKDIGPLVNTDLTRCIHCTRCVRFGKEIAGVQELGMTGRSEFSEIGTFVEKSMDSELSGNVIDLCPVGALTSKPFRYSARAWELNCREGVAGHDSTGSNLLFHVKGSALKRVTPRQNEKINEVWLSDRDRFAYEGIQTDQRCVEPQLRQETTLKGVDWQTALAKAAEVLKDSKPHVLVNQNATLEEMTLLNDIKQDLGGQLDSRLRQRDFSGSAQTYLNDAVIGVDAFEQADQVLVIGSHLTEEHPMIAHRFRKAGAALKLINAKQYHLRIKRTQTQLLKPSGWSEQLAKLVKAVLIKKQSQALLDQLEVLTPVKVDATSEQWASELLGGKKSMVVLGNLAAQSDCFSELLEWSKLLAEQLDAQWCVLPEQANSTGAKWAGLDADLMNTNVALMLGDLGDEPLVLFNVDPDHDTAHKTALLARMKRSKVIAFVTHHSDSIAEYADVILPIATYAETSGTFVNAAGQWQSFSAAVPAMGESKPGWKVLRVLANLLDVEGCLHQSSSDVITSLRASRGSAEPKPNQIAIPSQLGSANEAVDQIVYWHAYAGDAILRHASALQQTTVAQQGEQGYISADTFESLSLTYRKQEDKLTKLEQLCQISDEVAEGCYWIPASAKLPMGEG